jgi:hypothetical protein
LKLLILVSIFYVEMQIVSIRWRNFLWFELIARKMAKA